MVSDNPEFDDPTRIDDVGGAEDTLRPAEATDADELRNKDGDEVVEPPEGWQQADRVGAGESLDERLAAEEPDTPAGAAAGSPDPDVEQVDGTGVHRGQVDGTPEDGDSLFPVVE